MLCYRRAVTNYFTLTHPLLQFCVVWGQKLHEELMLDWVQVFRKIVCDVIFRFNIEYNKLALAYTISDPVKTHVDGFRPFLLY